MQTTALTLLTIVSEGVLKDRLIEEIQAAGAKGYTLTEVQGEGARHRRVGEIMGANTKLEIVANAEVADRLLKRLAEEYFPHFAVIAYTTTVQVVRGEKYV